MKNKSLFLSVLVLLTLSTPAFSKVVNCEIKFNLDTISKTTVTTIPNQKVLIDDIDQAAAYITEEANGQFTVEAYLPDFDARIYGQGSLVNKTDKVSASIWGRAAMIDISCSPETSKLLK